jgi:hypothetical protein
MNQSSNELLKYFVRTLKAFMAACTNYSSPLHNTSQWPSDELLYVGYVATCGYNPLQVM